MWKSIVMKQNPSWPRDSILVGSFHVGSVPILQMAHCCVGASLDDRLSRSRTDIK
jgi:hypothetical protein